MDRVVRGLIAGIAGGLIMNVWDFISKYILDFHDHLYLDWAATIIYGHPPVNLAEFIFSLLAQIAWSGFLGLLFVMLMPYADSKNYLIVGGFMGFLASFLIFSIPQIFKIPGLMNLSTTTVISHSIGAIIWGYVVAQTMQLLKLKFTAI
ncbi:hypothetical protein [Dethiobacter alkaliphilus]|uniref:hypothetical protein n=1 Tax=Dethiobacter alkaliphilus TaxID=427926 RepID=UPI002227CC29|nr:hypothetical protein [Dethiobacter alkaliphilus]MCW3489227.1 hypothetical protein [Dethiobacter alkaliphilus]